jgi:hypothetical protein
VPDRDPLLLRCWGHGRSHRARLLDLGVRRRLFDAEGAQLTLHERPEPGPVVPLELLQGFDLLLQRCALGSQATDGILVSLPGFPLESIGIRLGIVGNLLCPGSRIGQALVSIAPSTVGVRLGVSGNLLRRCSRIGQSLVGFPSSTVGVRLGFSGYLRRRCSRIRPNVVSLVLSGGHMLVGRSLGQNQHLKGLTLGFGIGEGMRLVQ